MAMILLAISLLLPIGVQGQLKGEYHHWNEWTSETITFLSRHRFVYEWSGESTDKRGAGTYSYRGDSLVLNFGHDGEPLVDRSCLVQRTDVKGNTCVLNIRTFEARDSVPYERAAVLVRDGNRFLKGMHTDVDGRCQFSVPADSDSLWIEMKAWEYQTISLPLQSQSNYEISAYFSNRAIRNLAPGERKVLYFAQKPTKEAIYLATYRGENGHRFQFRSSKTSTLVD